MNLTKNRTRWFVLVQILLCMGLAFVAYGLVFNRSQVLGLEDQKNVDSTKTALVGTAQALLGPFPTATVPTSTATDTATATPLISATPTMTASLTPSPSNTPTRFVSGTPRDSNSSGSSGIQKPSSTPRATYTNSAPTHAPTQLPPPTDPPTQPPPPTDPPIEPPQPTDVPTLPPIGP